MTKPKQPWRCQRCTGLGITIPRATARSTICAWCADELATAGQRWCTTGRHGSADWTPDGKMCRACQAAANAAYRAAHHEEAIQASRDYYAAHREQLITYNHAYYQAKRAQILEQKRAYYAERRETIKAQRRRYWPHRPVSSIEKERARHREKGHIYKANERAASLKRKLMTWRQMIGREAP